MFMRACLRTKCEVLSRNASEIFDSALCLFTAFQLGVYTSFGQSGQYDARPNPRSHKDFFQILW